MANLKDMQATIMQVAIKAATMVIKAMREADLPGEIHTRKRIPDEHQRPKET